MISIEGNIGAGKSEVLKILAARGFQIRPEPVQSWTLLKPYYEDPSTFAFALQAQILVSYADLETEEPIFVERSARSALEVFAKMLVDQRKISDSQMSVLSCMYFQLPIPQSFSIVYLDIDSKACLQRISERRREGEEAIAEDYLETVRLNYEKYLASVEDQINVIKIDVQNLSPAEVADKILSYFTSTATKCSSSCHTLHVPEASS
jgi:deoxyadenosine/deoxycytidine kinase